jgi:GT2 family glycosyltransferase
MTSPASESITAIIPTYRREGVLIHSIDCLLKLQPGPAEILVVDQTLRHSPETERRLAQLHHLGRICWIRLSAPSIPRAMNEGLRQATQEIVLFLDDDIIPAGTLVSAHARAHETGAWIVAGQVLQPGEEPLGGGVSGPFRFCSREPRPISELMAGNFSIRRELALKLGGFDENFVRVAYRFEAEFSERALAAGYMILFEPDASIRHLQANDGGTRSYGNHLRTARPSHSVGDYYYLLRSKRTPQRLLKILKRPFRAVCTKHHLKHPWWIPASLAAEALGFAWALVLGLRGPRLIQRPE